MIRALLFDMDGTLVDSEQLHYRTWGETLRGHGIEDFPFDEFFRYVGVSNEQLAQDYIDSHRLPVTVETLVRQKQRLYLEMIPTIQPIPGVRELIGRMHQRYLLAVASSSDRIELEQILETLELRHHFSEVVGGDMVRHKKPDPEIYLQALTRLRVAPHEAVAFEDSQTGVAAAKDAGIATIAIPSPLQKDGDFSRADRILHGLALVDDQLLVQLASQ